MQMKEQQKNVRRKSCYQCEGKGYLNIRDCSGEIQRTETCSFCSGKGYTDKSSSIGNY